MQFYIFLLVGLVGELSVKLPLSDGATHVSSRLPTLRLMKDTEPVFDMLCSVYSKIIMMLLDNLVRVCRKSAARACCGQQIYVGRWVHQQ
jgi:hypothetical protein